MQEVNYSDSTSLSSLEMHKKVVESFVRRHRRGQKNFNAHLSDSEIESYCKLDEEAEKIMQMAIERYRLSFRSITSIKKVARSIADLENEVLIRKEHLLEALSYRKKL
jgi:magnesium chelatase family protein